MEQIKIGTCIPGTKAKEWLPHMVKAGFETVSLNFHMSLENTDLKELAKEVKEILGDSGVRVSCLGYYCNALQYEEHKKTLEYCIDSARLFGAGTVTTFAGALEGKPVEEAIPVFGKVFGDLAKRAEDNQVKIGFENCPMGGSWNQPTCNIGFNPKAWEMMFNEVTSDNIGLEWEPAHQMSQLIDPIPQLKQWIKKVVHVHGKDSSVDWDLVRRYGVFGGVKFAYDRTPGFGDTNWRDILSILHMGGYNGDICVEGYHDPIYNGDWEMTAQLHSLNYLKWCRGGDFVPNPWDK
ncbi:sugar phosphate isomerase/epimerase family protein [Anaerocolumna sp. MB42-C2]|uniref:sugar phosphate isomerase/epimerase family protein n=1 Tax=Anaerocolumna sp. MB42-C2 TaxID=3070997 RepID=UPI0027E060D0|nr:sugar phosphate isomerase/epimerase [Anaerocolumna sp. MB42-C2]WMJ87300.1 sugar phosphate isomerase/epimerase [Anaerocolumna sp. MB42-C2]